MMRLRLNQEFENVLSARIGRCQIIGFLRVSLKLIPFLLVFGCTGLANADAPLPGSPLEFCHSQQDEARQCFSVHGRLGHYFGNHEWRIWPVGTHRLLAVEPDPDDIRYSVVEPLPSLVKDESIFSIFGDFQVCPLDPDEPGRMRRVCVNRTGYLGGSNI